MGVKSRDIGYFNVAGCFSRRYADCVVRGKKCEGCYFIQGRASGYVGGVKNKKVIEKKTRCGITKIET